MTAPGRHALIVAVSTYQEPKLQCLRAPATDAEQLAAVLRDPEIGDFDVELAIDEDEPRLSRRIARFFSNRNPDDLLFLHFSCHGVKDDAGELHLATTDTEMGDLLGVTSISSSWLSAQIGRSRSKRIVVLLDCCFSGSFPFGARARAGAAVDVRGALEGRGRAVITASNSMEYAYEGDELSGTGEPSIFTSAVVEALKTGRADRDQDRRISIDELYEYVYDQVRERTPSQSPQMMSSLEGPLYVARSNYVAPVDPARLDDHLLALVESPLAGARLGAVTELARLLHVRDRAVILAARVQLQKLANDDSQRVCAAARAALDGLASSPAAPPQPAWSQPAPAAPAQRPLPPAAPAQKPAGASAEPVRWRPRCAAAAIDALLAFLLGCIPAAAIFSSSTSSEETMSDATAYGMFTTSMVIGGILYALLFRPSRGGRTVGKRAYGLAVRGLDGTAPRRAQILLRDGVKWLLLGATWGLAAFLLVPLARRRADGRPLHDVMAGTTVTTTGVR